MFISGGIEFITGGGGGGHRVYIWGGGGIVFISGVGV